MTLFEYPSQRLPDWLSQKWVTAWSRRIEPASVPWLMGPFGEVDTIGDNHIERLARDEGLEVTRGGGPAGIVAAIDDLIPDEAARNRLAPQIAAFYERTSRYEFDVWAAWRPLFGLGGRLLHRVYSRRLQQLDLPQQSLDTALGVTSDIIRLVDPATGATRHTVWHRVLRKTGQIVYSGYYSVGRTADDRRCMKAVFPLPRGNATVLLRPEVTPEGGLDLHCEGRRFGDTGFYFVLRDRRNRHFAQHVRSLRERIAMYLDNDGLMRADHTATFWGRRVFEMHYRIREREAVKASA
ncbi:MAG: hypothetical protein ACF8QF_02130 [Phycisphaerales bacterium]